MDLIQKKLAAHTSATDNSAPICSFPFRIQRNSDKSSSAHYLCRQTNKRSQISNELEADCKVEENNIKLLNKAFQDVEVCPKEIKFERGCFAVQLSKPQAAQQIIYSALKRDNNQGDIKSVKVCKRYVHIEELSYQPDTGYTGTLDLLRQLFIAQHLQKILAYEGSQAPMLSNVTQTLDELICSCVAQTGLNLTHNKEKSNIAELLKNSPHSNWSDEEEKWKVVFAEKISILGTPVTKCWLKPGSRMYNTLDTIISLCQPNEPVEFYHLVSSNSHSFQHELMKHILALLLPESIELITHKTTTVAGIKLTDVDNKETNLVAEYIKSRKEYLIQSSEEKYGSSVHDEGFWKERIDELTLTTAKFELLTRISHQSANIPSKLTASNCGDVKIGSFIMYNCARLATLFTNYQQWVKNGTYPDLYKREDVDFSLLKTEDEWILVFHYINVYPVLMSELSDHTSTVGSPSTKLSKFLHSLSRDFSTYYSRTHILGENRPYLIPTMMARLWLLKIIYSMFTEALSMFGVTPYDSM